MRQIAEIKIAALIVAAEVADAEERKVGIFDFIFVAGSDAEFGEDVAGLRVEAGAVVVAGTVRGR